ncbi:MAG TPA: hypothetical protein VFN35_36770 [Ktedonobacteraceae bacterium]|nr:hypothetical protein [Ktedonobacteraceae bacterium]
MSTTVRIFQGITGLAGLAALILGLLRWIFQLDIITIHMICGLTVALGLLSLSILMLFGQKTRLWGIIGIVYALFVPFFGLNQFTILIGNLHWLVQLAHLLVGIGALALVDRIARQYLMLKKPAEASVNLNK